MVPHKTGMLIIPRFSVLYIMIIILYTRRRVGEGQLLPAARMDILQIRCNLSVTFSSPQYSYLKISHAVLVCHIYNSW